MQTQKLEITELELRNFIHRCINHDNPLKLHMIISEAVTNDSNPRVMKKYHIQVATTSIPHHLTDFVFSEVDIPATSLFAKIDHLHRALKLSRDSYRINYGW